MHSTFGALNQQSFNKSKEIDLGGHSAGICEYGPSREKQIDSIGDP